MKTSEVMNVFVNLTDNYSVFDFNGCRREWINGANISVSATTSMTTLEVSKFTKVVNNIQRQASRQGVKLFIKARKAGGYIQISACKHCTGIADAIETSEKFDISAAYGKKHSSTVNATSNYRNYFGGGFSLDF